LGLIIAGSKVNMDGQQLFAPMLISIYLELATFTHHQQRLSDDLQIPEAENLHVSFSV